MSGNDNASRDGRPGNRNLTASMADLDRIEQEALMRILMRQGPGRDARDNLAYFNGILSSLLPHELHGVRERKSPIDVYCGKCGCPLFLKLTEYALGPATQRHIEQELFTNASFIQQNTSAPYHDTDRLTCMNECHKENGLWLIDTNEESHGIRHHGYKYAVACGRGLAEIRQGQHNLYYDAMLSDRHDSVQMSSGVAMVDKAIL